MDSDSAAKISQILQLTVMKICQSVVSYTDQLAVQVCMQHNKVLMTRRRKQNLTLTKLGVCLAL